VSQRDERLELVEQFARLSGLAEPAFDLRPDQRTVIVSICNPNPRFYQLVIVRPRKSSVSVQMPEARYLIRNLSESLNVGQHTFGSDFYSRYTKSVSGAEELIRAQANHVVFGRRGAGKSSLLIYSRRLRDEASHPCVWIDMQVFHRRSDVGIARDILVEILIQLAQKNPGFAPSEIVNRLSLLPNDQSMESKLRQMLPELKRALSDQIGNGDLFVFLDDFHVVGLAIQPTVLSLLYSTTRGNRVYLKLSAIETSTKIWDPVTQSGLEMSHDAQAIRLDYNLTTTEKAASHIKAILDSHAVYCGLPGLRPLCTSDDVIPRLVWVSAGVPRDALSLFAQAMTRTVAEGRRHVSVTAVNMAASDMVSQKLRDIDADLPTESRASLQSVLEEIREFCLKKNRKNAFLVEIQSSAVYRDVMRLVDLRLLHVIAEAITVGEAGRKFVGLILDYGFYTGMRAARSVDLFNKQIGKMPYKELRKLPIFGSQSGMKEVA
jgi:hypothetical protein